MKMNNLVKRRKGQGLVEYALLVAGVALICAAAVSVFGHKTNDMLAAIATILPGAHTDDNGPIVSGHIIETTSGATGAIQVDAATIATTTGTDRLGQNVLGTKAGAPNGFDGLVFDSSAN
jgi:pilus assembly protein Flp/PilA